ncbi:MAG TPA: addiction module toxin, HicA family [Euryarchaeota archaeon]|nr:YcfA-like protein [archaeon BMS3Bbin15]HDL15033.1 addiction module toxin, HicA family [Euryarchaeota archaeon]
MSRLPIISGKEATKAFSKIEWYPNRQVGSHLIMRKKGLKITLSIPQHKELKPGLLRKLIKDAGLTAEEFIKLL